MLFVKSVAIGQLLDNSEAPQFDRYAVEEQGSKKKLPKTTLHIFQVLRTDHMGKETLNFAVPSGQQVGLANASHCVIYNTSLKPVFLWVRKKK